MANNATGQNSKARKRNSHGGPSEAFELKTVPSKALIWMDDLPLRSSASLEFKKIYGSYNKHVAEINHHEQKVRPSYYQWLLSQFGGRINDMQKVQAELIHKSALLQRMRELCIFEGFNRASAFDQAHEELDVDESFEDDAQGSDDSDEFENNFDSDFDFEGDSSSYGPSRGKARNSAHSDDEFQSENSDASTVNSAQSFASKLKSLYRKLAQALHPDLAGESSELSRDFWLETQEAYRKQDLSHLEMIWTLVKLQTEALSRELRLFDLRKAVDHMKEKLRLVKQSKRKLKREDPSWGFDKKSRPELAAQIRSELDREFFALSSALEDIEDDLRVFERSARPGRKRSRAEHMSYEW